MPKTDSSEMRRFLDVLLKHGNFTRAARDLYISQPYLTQSIRNVEKTLGVKIINRDVSPLRLTPAGRTYYQYLTALENDKAAFTKQLRQYTHADQVVLRLGILPSLGNYLLPLFLPAFLKAHPTTKIELTEDILARNEQRVLRGELDFLIGQNPETIAPGLDSFDRGRDGYYAIIPNTVTWYQPHQAYLNPGALTTQDLLQAPLVLSPHGSSIRRQVDYLLQKYNVSPNIVIESTSTATITKLATAGLGVTLLPDSVHTRPDPKRYNLLPLPQDLLSLNYFIAYPSGHQLNKVEKDLVTIFLTQLEADLAQSSTIP
ncbi:LysR family transcriptional regulator [Lactiplantibacillus pentosus]|uniref:LysR family transcriptional regulator n=1 Tax=Lactiplantibacillus pentosus TaxID=1589 RepID=UPI003C20F3F8